MNRQPDGTVPIGRTDLLEVEVERLRAERDHLASLVVIADIIGAQTGRPRTREEAIGRTILELAPASVAHRIHSELAAALAEHDRRSGAAGE